MPEFTKKEQIAIKLAIVELQLCQDNTCPETAHTIADMKLIELLESFGLHDVVNEYRKVDKWYC